MYSRSQNMKVMAARGVNEPVLRDIKSFEESIEMTERQTIDS
jgi:hypothetical protein